MKLTEEQFNKLKSIKTKNDAILESRNEHSIVRKFCKKKLKSKEENSPTALLWLAERYM